MKAGKIRFAAAALLFALCFAAVGAGAAVAVQSHMINARNYLNSALSQLEQAQPDKGGHRNNAINNVKAAIYQVNLGIQYAR